MNGPAPKEHPDPPPQAVEPAMVAAPLPVTPALVRAQSRRILTRNALLAATCGLLVLVFVVYGVWSMAQNSKRIRKNTLVGLIVEKQFTPLEEELITFGRNGLNSKKSAGEYLLKVKVEGYDPIFEVPVEKYTYDNKRVGDALTFVRTGSK